MVSLFVASTSTFACHSLAGILISMSEIRLSPLNRLGFDFVPGEDDATRPFPPDTSASDWRLLNENEIGILENLGNKADDWQNILVKTGFSPRQVENCRFFGPNRIGSLSSSILEYHDLKLPVGLRSCTIVSCDIGDDVALRNVQYMAHMTVEDRCMLFNINEILTTNHAKFGNGVVMDGEDEDVRIWLEIANENGGRKVLPFEGMLPADAWIWSKYRDDKVLMNRFVEITCKIKESRRGSFGRIGKGSVIKDCRVLKDVKIGEAAYIKGCNKLKNLTINSDSERVTQLGEGCELVNGIIGFGCRIFYGVKAVRFILNDHSSLKYGARLINAVLGSNSTISCCEVLNSLIFGSHEQHHNSSFLCASVLKGQTNMASAATVGSNHNSRSSDGEIVADRGFWPGLSVSLKHNSLFAAFCLIAKGSYPSELDIPLPFCLVSNDETAGELLLMPGYWFRYNMYALARNSAKGAARDQRLEKHLNLEYDWLAPDTVMQMLAAREILETWAMDSAAVQGGAYVSGRALLEAGDSPDLIATAAHPVENGRRPVRILHAGRGWKDYGRMIRFWCIRELLSGPEGGRALLDEVLAVKPTGMADSGVQGNNQRRSWENLGGQLVSSTDLEKLKSDIKQGKIEDWKGVHDAYTALAENYESEKRDYARLILPEIAEEQSRDRILQEARETAEMIFSGIKESRAKDYENPFRNITFENSGERDAVVGSFEENAFIRDAEDAFRADLKLLGD